MKKSVITPKIIAAHTILFSIIAVISMFLVSYNAIKDDTTTTNSKYSFVAKVKRVEIVNNKFYIIDYDGHIFITDFNDPELLYLEDGSYIKVYFNTDIENDTAITDINDYDLYYDLENQYYMNASK